MKRTRLTPSEFKKVVLEAVSDELNELTQNQFTTMHNSTRTTQHRQPNNIPDNNAHKGNLDKIRHGVVEPLMSDCLITPFKTKYLFHCTNLRSVAALTIFELEQIYEITIDKAIFKGKIIFNGKPLNGAIIIDLNSREISYNYNGSGRKYKLTIDPSKKQLWNKLVQTLLDTPKAY